MALTSHAFFPYLGFTPVFYRFLSSAIARMNTTSTWRILHLHQE
ncbi:MULTISPECIES: hypothetical protein [unclassified Nostoc]|nr:MULTISPECIES: hypothetical protein [unclassified Nostoc]